MGGILAFSYGSYRKLSYFTLLPMSFVKVINCHMFWVVVGSWSWQKCEFNEFKACVLGGMLCGFFFEEQVVVIRMSSLSMVRNWHVLVEEEGL